MGLSDKVTENRIRGVEFPDYSKMTDEELKALDDNGRAAPEAAEVGAPTNGSGRFTH